MSLLIDESNYRDQIHERLARLPDHETGAAPGCIADPFPYRAHPFAIPMSDLLTPIPRDLWPALIREREGKTLHALKKDKLPPHDQDGTNYCWVHGSVRSIEVLRAFEGQGYTLLSAESVGVPVTGGRNRGGYPSEALDRMISHGTAEQTFWPNNDLSTDAGRDGWEENAKLHRVIRWAQVETWEMQITCALLCLPVAIGLAWWSHLVCQLDAVILPDGTVGIGFDNSWGPDYGENGYATLTERRGTADLGAFAPLTTSFFIAPPLR